MPCRDHVLQLQHYREAIQQAEIHVAIVTFDAKWMAEAYVAEHAVDWPMLLDSEMELYQAYGLLRASWWQLVGPAAIWRYLTLMWNGSRPKRPGRDLRQLGGDVLIDPRGVIRFFVACQSPFDRPNPDEILRARHSGEN